MTYTLSLYQYVDKSSRKLQDFPFWLKLLFFLFRYRKSCWLSGKIKTWDQTEMFIDLSTAYILHLLQPSTTRCQKMFLSLLRTQLRFFATLYSFMFATRIVWVLNLILRVFNPLVPSVHFLDVFPLFLSKRRFSSERIFSMKPSKSPLSIFLSTGANLKIITKKADLWGAKNWRPISPKKIFFTFSCWDDLRVFVKAKKNFFEKFFPENFWSVWRRTSKRRRPQLWSKYTKKFRVTFLFVKLKNLSC